MCLSLCLRSMNNTAQFYITHFLLVSVLVLVLGSVNAALDFLVCRLFLSCFNYNGISFSLLLHRKFTGRSCTNRMKLFHVTSQASGSAPSGFSSGFLLMYGFSASPSEGSAYTLQEQDVHIKGVQLLNYNTYTNGIGYGYRLQFLYFMEILRVQVHAGSH